MTKMARCASRRITVALSVAAFGLAALSVVANLFLYRLPQEEFEAIARRLDLDSEAGMGSWYSSSLFLVCAGLLVLVSRLQRARGAPYAGRWAVLAVVFVLLSADESIAFHEMSINPLRNALNTGGLLYLPWIIPGIGLVAVVVVIVLPILQRLPRKLVVPAVGSAGLYLGGAVGMEAIGAAYIEAHGSGPAGERDTGLVLLITVEETLEMSGLVLFLHTLLVLLAQLPHHLQVVNRVPDR